MTGCLRIEANNVTLRNFTMDVSGCFTGIRLENGVSGNLIEYGEVDGNNTAGDCLRGLASYFPLHEHP